MTWSVQVRSTVTRQAIPYERLADSEFIAGDRFTVADIAALVACDFAKVLKMRVGNDTPDLERWYDAVSARPSAAA
jgi:glutathione S-transferase